LLMSKRGEIPIIIAPDLFGRVTLGGQIIDHIYLPGFGT
jgi:hypothetical protein